jgi:hypothetical protein
MLNARALGCKAEENREVAGSSGDEKQSLCMLHAGSVELTFCYVWRREAVDDPAA